MPFSRATDVAAIQDARATIESRIAAAGGDPSSITIVAVTKSFGIETVQAALAAGMTTLGENYAAELIEKAAGISNDDVSWHYLGAIQTNKVGRLAQVTSCFEGLAREREAEAIALRRPGATVMVQVELTGLPGRNGVAPEEVQSLVERAQTLGLEVAGLMTVAPQEPDRARVAFRKVREMKEDLGLAEASMGMSDDLEIAVEEGSTMIRVGRGLFGARS